MPKLRSPYVNGTHPVAGGIGEGLDNFLDYWRRKREIEKGQDFKREEVKTAEASKSADEVRKGADINDYSPDLQKIMRNFLGDYKGPSDTERAAGVISKIKPDTPDAEIQAGLDANRVNTAPVYGQTAQSPGEIQENGMRNLESTQFGPRAAKPWEQAMTAKKQSIEELLAAGKRTTDQKAAEAQATARGTGLGGEEADAANAPAILERKKLDATTMGPINATNAGLTEGAQLDAQNDPARQSAHARGVGLDSSMRAAGAFPWEQKLAQTRADLSLANQTALQEYLRKNPKATPAAQERLAGANHALEMSGQVRTMLDEMDKRGMLGPLKGRATQLASGTIKSEDLFPNPDDARLAATFFSEMGYLSKKAAQVHGGVRAAGSPQMAAQFEKILNGFGDKSLTAGQLDAVDNIMRIYSGNPDAPDMLAIPGLPNPKDQGPGTQPLDPSIEELLNRGKVKR